MKRNSIKIEVYGGCVTEVTGLPEGWDYEIVDQDHLEELQATSNKQQAPGTRRQASATIGKYNKK